MTDGKGVLGGAILLGLLPWRVSKKILAYVIPLWLLGLVAMVCDEYHVSFWLVVFAVIVLIAAFIGGCVIYALSCPPMCDKPAFPEYTVGGPEPPKVSVEEIKAILSTKRPGPPGPRWYEPEDPIVKRKARDIKRVLDTDPSDVEAIKAILRGDEIAE